MQEDKEKGQSLGAAMDKAAKSVAKAGSAIGKSLSGVGRAAISVGGEFETSMRAIRAQTGQTAEEVRVTEMVIRDLALTQGRFSTRDMAGALQSVARYGQDNQEQMMLLEQAIRLADASGSGLVESMRALDGALRESGESIEENTTSRIGLNEAAAALVATLGESREGVEGLSEVFLHGMDVGDDYESMLAMMEDRGTSITEGFGLMRNGLDEVLKMLGGPLGEAFAKVGESIAGLVKEMREGGGLHEQAQQLGESIGRLGEAAANFIERAVPIAMEWLPKLAGGFATVLDIAADLAPKIAGLYAGFKTFSILTKITKLVKAFAEALKIKEVATLAVKGAKYLLNMVMKANPFVRVAYLVGALVTALVVLWNTNDDFRNAVIRAWESLKAVARDTWDAIVSFFSNAAEIGEQLISGIWQGLLGKKSWLLGHVTGFFSDVIAAVRGIFGINSPSTVFAGIGGSIIDGLWGGLQSKWQGLSGSVRNFFGGIVDTAKRALDINSPSMVFAHEVGQPIAQGVELGIGQGAPDSFADAFLAIREALSQSEQDVADSLANKVQMFADGFEEIRRGTLDIMEQLRRSLVELMQRTQRDVMHIVQQLTTEMGNHLRTQGHAIGQNFFQALGEGLIAEQANLMARAMGVADAIVEVFRMRSIVGEFGPIFPNWGSGSIPVFPHATAHAGARGFYQAAQPQVIEHSITQNFYGIRERETGYQAYRAFQKAELARGGAY